MEKHPFPRKKNLRLPNYDYKSPGAYFLTLVTYHRKPIFGEIIDGKVNLNLAGELVGAIWRKLPQSFPVELDGWVIMPNHFHAILWILETSDKIDLSTPRQQPKGTQPGSLGSLVQNFKAVTSRRINALFNSHKSSIWQPNYYERVIRMESELQNARWYILANPIRWQDDEENKPNKI